MLLALLVIVLLLFVALPLAGLTFWALLSIIFVGLIIGGLARLVLPGWHPIGLGWTILLGWLGSLIGGYLGDQVFDVNRFLTVLLEIAVAAVLIAVYSRTVNPAINRGRFRSLR